MSKTTCAACDYLSSDCGAHAPVFLEIAQNITDHPENERIMDPRTPGYVNTLTGEVTKPSYMRAKPSKKTTARDWKCNECGRRMALKAAERASSKGCPKCGGVDIDLA